MSGGGRGLTPNPSTGTALTSDTFTSYDHMKYYYYVCYINTYTMGVLTGRG